MVEQSVALSVFTILCNQLWPSCRIFSSPTMETWQPLSSYPSFLLPSSLWQPQISSTNFHEKNTSMQTVPDRFVEFYHHIRHPLLFSHSRLSDVCIVNIFYSMAFLFTVVVAFFFFFWHDLRAYYSPIYQFFPLWLIFFVSLLRKKWFFWPVIWIIIWIEISNPSGIGFSLWCEDGVKM